MNYELRGEEAENQRDRITKFFMQAPAGVCILSGKEFVFELVNSAYQQILPNRTLLNRPLFEAVAGIKRATIAKAFRKCFQDRNFRNYHRANDPGCRI